MSKRIIYGIHITNRVKEVPAVQKVLTDYGCFIKTRLGLHEVSDASCAPSGLLITEMHGDEARILEMEGALNGIEGVSVQKMVFEN